MEPIAVTPSSDVSVEQSDPVSKEMERFRDVAGRFEEIFLRQLVKELGVSETGSKAPNAHLFESMGNEALARGLLDGGGIGIEKILIEKLSGHVEATARQRAGLGVMPDRDGES